MALNWSTVDKESKGHGVKVLVYGDAGAGKTRLCATAPSPLIISAEAGLLTLRRLINEGTLAPETPVLVIHQYTDLVDALDWVKKNAIKSGIQTVCLDSISEIVEQILTAEKAKTKDPRQAYGEMATQAVQRVKEFRDISGLHVLITAKQTVVKDPTTGVEKAAPTAPGQQVGPALPYLFDEVFHAFTDKDPQTGKNYWALRTAASFNVTAKDRSGSLEEVEYPDLGYLFNKILNPAPSAQ